MRGGNRTFGGLPVAWGKTPKLVQNTSRPADQDGREQRLLKTLRVIEEHRREALERAETGGGAYYEVEMPGDWWEGRSTGLELAWHEVAAMLHFDSLAEWSGHGLLEAHERLREAELIGQL